MQRQLLQFSRREQQVRTVQTVHFPWRSLRCCSWTRLSCPLCATTGARVPDSSVHIPVVAQRLIPMGLTVQQTIETPRLQFLDKELMCPLLDHTGANCAASSWLSTGAALGQGCRARCVHDKCPDPVRRAVQKTVENPLLQFINKVVIIPVGAHRQVPMVSLFSRP